MKSKPVFEFSPDEQHEMEYFTHIRSRFGRPIVLASNSLNNLKNEVRNRRIILAWIQCKTGLFSYGQNLDSEYPYQPNYKR
ncbi:hypothetical protein BWD14_05580 [Leptospira santarosai]|uniref:Uncharacterized protein n=1 Tax=Leptospira santarosai TaxID=28183 RepID=A0AB73MBN5_9LEPT|nr:Uncharacterized protein XB17_00086 [Leptospira santarosai]OLY60897.1 hypothetical protein BV917_07975 [Leptospira santarosai serovar Guaricura]ONF94091.1 hypothetical protein BWD14_05580 [Leptospira santarosai]